MNREEEIKVLMADHCTKDEAIKHLILVVCGDTE
jgi:hypothetical protein